MLQSFLVEYGLSTREGVALMCLAEHATVTICHSRTRDLAEQVAQADVVIDFSLPEATDRTLTFCQEHEAALVLGTTGLSDAQLAAMRRLAHQVPVVHASNMSVGMNVLFALVGKAAAMLVLGGLLALAPVTARNLIIAASRSPPGAGPSNISSGVSGAPPS